MTTPEVPDAPSHLRLAEFKAPISAGVLQVINWLNERATSEPMAHIAVVVGYNGGEMEFAHSPGPWRLNHIGALTSLQFVLLQSAHGGMSPVSFPPVDGA